MAKNFEVKLASSDRSDLLKLTDAELKINRSLRQAWFAAGDDLKAEADRAVLANDKKGRLYIIKRGGRRRKHRASAPGQSHANLSGALRRSIGWKVRGRDLEFGYGVTRVKVPYASFLEDGTSRMQPRPTLANAVKAMTRNIEQHLEGAAMAEFE